MRRPALGGQPAHARRGAADCGKHHQAAGVAAMSELSQFIIAAGFGALCFGCGYLTGFIVTRNR
jgi:hypothetical protein